MKDDPHPGPPEPPSDPATQPDETQTLLPLAQRLGPGAVLDGRYRIEKFLGLGGMGRVYLARDLELDQEVALKIIRPELLRDRDATERFKRELILARRVSHRNVVRIHDLGEFQGLRYLTMSYIEGRSLKDLLKESGPLPAERAVALFTQICEAVSAAHGEGVVHRDLKPANIMIDGDNRVFITDFGIARSMDSSDLTVAGGVVGTPAYLSPEQARGEEADARSDIFTLGLILREMLAGPQPGRGGREGASGMEGVDPQPPRHLVQIVDRCLAVDPEQRYATAEELLGDLRGGKAGAAPASRRKWGRRGVAAVMALSLAVLLYIVIRQVATGPAEPASYTPLAAVLVLPFESHGDDDSWLPSAVSDLLISDLGREARLRVVGSDRVHRTLRDLKLEPGVYDRDSVRRLSQILDADIVVQGSVTRAGGQLRADAQVLAPSKPGPAKYLQAAAEQSELFVLVAELASQIKKELRVDPSAPVKAHTPTLEVLEAYQKGALALRRGDVEAASRLLREAIAMDPLLLAAYLKLSEAEEAAGRPGEAAAVLSRAFSVDSDDRRTSDMIHARHALLEGDLAQSVEIYGRLAQSHPNDPDILFELALAHEEGGDSANAAAALKKVIQLDPNHPRAYFHLGKDTILMGEAESAISDYLLKALGIATQLSDKRAEADVLNAIGVAYQRLGRYDEAIKHFNDSIAIKEELGNKQSAGTSLSNIAKIQISRGEFEQAEQILRRNLALFEEAGHQKGVADVHNIIGVLNEDRGRFPAALDSYKRSLQIRKQLGDDRLTAQSYDNIGYIYYLLGEYDNAQVYWQQALDLKTAIGEDAGVILSTQNMGFLQMAQGEVDAALESFLTALDRGRAIKFDNAVAVSLGNLATIHRRRGRYQAALDSYGEALQVLGRLGDKKGLAEYAKLKGDTLLELNALDEAQGEFATAFRLAREIRNAEIEADLEILAARLDRVRGKTEAAAERLAASYAIASKPGLEKVFARARIEEAWLRLDQGRLREASSLLAQARRHADSVANFWLRLETFLAEVALADRQKDPAKARRLAREALRLCQGLGLKPVEMRLLAAEARSLSALGEPAQAEECRRMAADLFQEIEKETPPRYVENLRLMPGAPEKPDRLKGPVN